MKLFASELRIAGSVLPPSDSGRVACVRAAGCSGSPGAGALIEWKERIIP